MDSKKLHGLAETVTQLKSSAKAVFADNAEFHKAIDGLDPFIFTGVEGDEYQVWVSDILFWHDPKVYMNELEIWHGQKSDEIHEEIVSYLQTTNQATVFAAMVEAIRRKRVTPFVGAGLSKPCNFPLWGEAINKLIASFENPNPGAPAALPTSNYLAEAKELVKHWKYLEAMQLLYQYNETGVANYIRNTFDRPKAIIGPVLHLPEIADGCIVTTNFDPLIEEVFIQRSRPFAGYMHGIQARSKFVNKLIQGERCILKLHGTVDDPGTYIFSQEQYAAAYGETGIDFTKPLAKTLRQIFVSSSLLFLGCSLEQDRTLALFEAVVAGAEFDVPEHFAIVSKSAAHDEHQAKETRLLKMKIRPIWYEVDADRNHTKLDQLLKYAVDCAAGRAR
jgi:SIR2-like domain